MLLAVDILVEDEVEVATDIPVEDEVGSFDGWWVVDTDSVVSIMGRWLYAVLDGQRVDVAYCVLHAVSRREFFFMIGEDRFGGALSEDRQAILMDTSIASRATWPWILSSWQRMELPIGEANSRSLLEIGCAHALR